MNYYYNEIFIDKEIIENGDIYFSCEFKFCTIILEKKVANFMVNCKIYNCKIVELNKDDLELYLKIDSKNDALLYRKHSNEAIRNKCKEILNANN